MKLKSINKSRLLAFKGKNLLVLEKVGSKKKYTLPGGIQKKKETDLKALIRESKEEIGIKFKKKELTYFITKKNVTKENEEVFKHYFITSKVIEGEKLLEPEKFERISWVPWYDTLDFLDKEDRSTVLIYCDKYRKETK
ncbi:NUDIX hydrolase [Winogradskyella sp. R77965]|uniref:NUDIX hydrolase n=1 Tax=Winogradskyella sp. R77965 TaxID=3093872 RepID=UPI0037DC0508